MFALGSKKMGMSLDRLLHLQMLGFLSKTKNRILDIGPQNVYEITDLQIRQFVQSQGAQSSGEAFEKEIERLIYFSIPRPEERTTLLSEITDLTDVNYNSIDVCPGLKTEILDLNFDALPEHMNGGYDVVLNFGTTEHIFNQWNCFEAMHDAVCVGGVIYHQLPGSGYLDHGYYCYTPLFFHDMAKANGYEIINLFVTQAGVNHIDQLKIPAGYEMSAVEGILGADNRIPCLNIHAILKKTTGQPFRATLEVATAHAPVNAEIAARYNSGSTGTGSERRPTNFWETQRQLAEASLAIEEANITIERIYQSRSWRITQPMRWLFEKLKG